MSATLQSVFAPQPTTQRGQTTRLSADPKGERIAYTNGRNVILRSIAHPEQAEVYSEHTATVTVAKWSPSGFYIASGDVNGNVRIWDTTQSTHLLKLETRPISGRVTDIAWDAESKRIIAVGDGKERFGHAFSFDTGSSVGEISGASKILNAVSIKSTRPYRAVTASDDLSVSFYQGPPFKFTKSLTQHTRFVQDVQFSPDGQFAVSVGLDSKIFLYDGASGDVLGEVTDQPHTGGIFAVAWSPDSQRFLTSSADQTAKIWSVADKTCLKTFTFSEGGSSIDQQQVGALWTKDHLLTLSLKGELHYLDAASGKILRKVTGHSKGLLSMVMDASAQKLYSAGFDGRLCSWETQTGLAHIIPSASSAHQINAIAVAGKQILSVALDDHIKSTCTSSEALTCKDRSSVALGSLPVAVASSASLSAVLTQTEVQLFLDGQKWASLAVSPWKPTALAFSTDGKELAVGGDDAQVHFYAIGDRVLQPLTRTLQHRGAITALAYNPAKPMLAVGDANRQILVYSTEDWSVVIPHWVFHTARVESIAWSPSGEYAASGSLDTNVEIWSTKETMRHICVKNAHTDSVTSVAWEADTALFSAGKDGCIKRWTVKHFA